MLKGISSVVGSATPIVSFGCYATGLFVGRKFCLAAGYKVGGMVASLMGKANVAEWNKASDHYWTLAKKDSIRDLTAAGGFIVVGLFSRYAGEALLSKEEKKPEEPSPKEPGYLVKIGAIVANTLYEYQTPILTVTGLCTAWKFRRTLAENRVFTKTVNSGLYVVEQFEGNRLINLLFFPLNILIDTSVEKIFRPSLQAIHLGAEILEAAIQI